MLYGFTHARDPESSKWEKCRGNSGSGVLGAGGMGGVLSYRCAGCQVGELWGLRPSSEPQVHSPRCTLKLVFQGVRGLRSMGTLAGGAGEASWAASSADLFLRRGQGPLARVKPERTRSGSPSSVAVGGEWVDGDEDRVRGAGRARRRPWAWPGPQGRGGHAQDVWARHSSGPRGRLSGSGAGKAEACGSL